MAIKDVPEGFVNALETRGIINDVRKSQIHKMNIGFFAAVDNVNIDNRNSSEQESIEELRRVTATKGMGRRPGL